MRLSKLVKNFVSSLSAKRKTVPRIVRPRSRWRPKRRVRVVKCSDAAERPMPLEWSPCHPSTITRFKATMACPKGHNLTLRNHKIAANGDVKPSVVCPDVDCEFHEYIRLMGWTFGKLK